MKGYEPFGGDALSADERGRLEARYRSFLEGAARLREVLDPAVEPCWASELEAAR